MLSRIRFLPAVVVAALAVSVSLTDAQATSAAPFKLLEPKILGSGCGPSTAFAQVSADGQAVSILFSDYSASTNANTSRSRRTCNFALPVEAAPGKSIGFYQVDFRGWAYVPPVEGASGTFMNEYFFAGQQGPTVKKTYAMGADEPIFDSTTIQVQSVIWSPCGGSTNFRINSALIASRPGDATEDVQMQLDSMDATVNGQVQIFVDSRDCDPTSAPTPPPTPTTPASTRPTATSPPPAPTPVVTTMAPAPAPTTAAPTTPSPTTPASTRPVASTPLPAATPVVTTLGPSTPATTTLAPPTPSPTTPRPSTPAQTTPSPSTPSATVPARTSPTPTIPEPTPTTAPVPSPTSAAPLP